MSWKNILKLEPSTWQSYKKGLLKVKEIKFNDLPDKFKEEIFTEMFNDISQDSIGDSNSYDVFYDGQIFANDDYIYDGDFLIIVNDLDYDWEAKEDENYKEKAEYFEGFYPASSVSIQLNDYEIGWMGSNGRLNNKVDDPDDLKELMNKFNLDELLDTTFRPFLSEAEKMRRDWIDEWADDRF